MIDIMNIVMRSNKPSVQFTPAALEARIVENGLVKEDKYPN
jgi:hypothetical protein